MQNIQFPVKFNFKISTLANDFSAMDAQGRTIAYVRQKMFKLKERIIVYNDESKSQVKYSIRADRWLDFSAAYAFYDDGEKEFGKIVRKGWRSIWKAKYEVIDQHGEIQYSIMEENAWIKIMDSVLGQIPVLNMLSGYLFNPSYILADLDLQPIIKLRKDPTLFGRNFTLEKIGWMDQDDDDRAMLALMMMILLERRRG